MTTDSLRLLVGTFTALPVPPPSRVDAGIARGALLLAPLAAVPAAAFVLVGHLAVRAGLLTPLLAAALVLAAQALLSRGLHLDGLADTVDGLSSGYDRTRALEVMRGGPVGPLGASALVLVLLVQAAALAALLDSAGGTTLAVTALLASRHSAAWACRSALPPARPDGLGAAMAGTVPVPAALGVTAAGAGAAAVAGALAAGVWLAGPVTWITAVVAAGAVHRRAVSRLGGITGDVLGAGIEVALASACGLAVAVLAIGG